MNQGTVKLACATESGYFELVTFSLCLNPLVLVYIDGHCPIIFCWAILIWIQSVCDDVFLEAQNPQNFWTASGFIEVRYVVGDHFPQVIIGKSHTPQEQFTLARKVDLFLLGVSLCFAQITRIDKSLQAFWRLWGHSRRLNHSIMVSWNKNDVISHGSRFFSKVSNVTYRNTMIMRPFFLD